ncbi:M14 family zinc carboxypeptidase [Virgibacillus sp. YIM 98842]|uniref:M14 family zinc carboxypeptidase n=1 Tax=Virgibacillus sp. YIM 98842 TaxID=2663533 RepID=UPI0013D9C16E|nr:M14 family zinc carboxypeptidase [Virgibacillus sp. YIM 98842]
MKNRGINKVFSVFMIVLLVMTMTPVHGFAENPDDWPTTGFEDRNAESWTTFEEEQLFLQQVDEMSERVNITQAGTSYEGRPIHLVRVGYPAAPSDEEIADGRNMIIVGTQHGREPSGREMSLQLLRDLAFTEDEQLLDLMRKTTILFIPTANPDGRVSNTRGNAQGINMNRDHLNMKTPEVQVIADVLNRFDPDIIVDAHERGGTNPHLEMLWPQNLNMDEELRDLSIEMIEDKVAADVEDEGYTTGPYPLGGGDERFLGNMAGLRHSIGILTEPGMGNSYAARTDMQMIAANSVLDFYYENFDRIKEVRDGSKERQAEAGADMTEPIYFDGSDELEPTKVEENPACGYMLHASQAEKIQYYLDIFSIETEQVGEDGVFVPMGQPMRTVIPLLLDERAGYSVAGGMPVHDCSNKEDLEVPPELDPQQYSTTFADEEAGSIPEDWSMMWKEGSWSVREQPSRLENYVDPSGDRRLLSWDNVGRQFGDVEVSGLVRSNGAGSTLFQLHLHASGDTAREYALATENSYYIDLRSSGTVRINRLFDSSFSNLASSSVPFDAEGGQWYQAVLQREGTTLRAKVWPYGEEEPNEWQVTAEDNFLVGGHVGPGHFDAGTLNEWAHIGVGTDGESAPRAPDHLIPEIDRTILQNRINEIMREGLNEQNYTGDSWTRLQDAIDEANALLEEEDVTEAQLDEALALLNDAYSKLQFRQVQYQTDFSEDQVGEMPEGWSTLWRDSDWKVQEDPRRLEHTVTPNDGRRNLVMDEPGMAAGDVEVSSLVRTSFIEPISSSSTLFHLHLHAFGEANNENSYLLDVRSNGYVRLNRNAGGSFSTLTTQRLPFDIEEDVWYNAVLKRDGNMLRGKVWPYGEDEPDHWQVEYEDDTFDSGYVGLGQSTGNTVNDHAFFGVGVGGEDAPRPPKDLSGVTNFTFLEERVAVIEAENLVEEDYSKASWETLQQALEHARAVLANENVSQSQIEEVLEALNEARANLTAKDAAQYQTDFSEDITGQPPAGWSTLWADSDWKVEENPSRLVHTVIPGEGRRALVMDEPGYVEGDVEVSSLVRTSGTGTTLFQLQLHASGDVDSENSYYMDLRTTGYIRINRNIDGAFSSRTNARLRFEVVPDEWYHAVFQREGNILRAKAWPLGEEEPDWQVEYVDDNLSGGYVGLGHSPGNVINEHAFFGVGVGGEQAPRAPEDLFDPEVDKTELQDLVDEIHAENLNEADYTEESWQALQEALTAAEEVLHDPDAAQEEVDSALTGLNEARDRLEERETEPISAAGMITSIEQFDEEGAFENDQVVRSLTLQLIAVDQYESQEEAEKAVRHMESFLLLLDHMDEQMSGEAYESLYTDAVSLIAKWE